VEIAVKTKPVADFTMSAPACMDEPVTFTNGSIVDNQATVTYTWNFGDGGTSADLSTTHIYSASPAASPSLTINYTGLSACTSTVSKPLTVFTSQKPEIVASAPDICPEATVSLSIDGIFNSVEWFSGSSSIGTSSAIDIRSPGVYSVTTHQTNGCIGTNEITIAPSVNCEAVDLVVPNMFSPNGDGQNDRWKIDGIESVPGCTMKVFDDRGTIVLEKKGYDVPGWDGTFNGKVLQDGVYFYVLMCPDRKPLKGSVLIVK